MNYKYLIFHLNRFGSPSGHDHSYHRIATGDEDWDWFHRIGLLLELEISIRVK